MPQEFIASITGKLFDMLYDNAGLQAMIDYAYTLLNENPVVLSDSSFRNLVTSTIFPSSEPIILKHKQKGFLSGGALDTLRNDRVINRLLQTRKPFFSTPTSSKNYDIAYIKGPWLFAPIRINNAFAAFLTVAVGVTLIALMLPLVGIMTAIG